MIAMASHDERGAYYGGQAGDQTGQEVLVRSWYNRPWDVVIRPKLATLGVRIARVASALCACQVIGYDQAERLTLWAACERIGWDITRLAELPPCECDCSSLVAVVLRFCGITIPAATWTGSLESAVMATGQFYALADASYTQSPKALAEGDILLNRAHHVAINLDNGDESGRVVDYAAIIRVSDYLNVRTGPGTDYSILQLEGHDLQLPNGMVIAICEECAGWGRINNIPGWIALRYTRR